MEILGRLLPLFFPDEIVPVGDLVVDRASGVAIGDAAIHAARGLIALRLFAERQGELAPVSYAITCREVAAILSPDFEKASDFAHFKLLR